MRSRFGNSDPEISSTLRVVLQLCSSLNQDRDACLQLHTLLTGIAAELKRSSGEQHMDGDVKMRKQYHKLLQKYATTLERMRKPRSMFRIGRSKTMLQALPSLYQRLKKLLLSSLINEKLKWIDMCDRQLTVIASELEILWLVATLRDGSTKHKTNAVKALSELSFQESNRPCISRFKAIPPLIALLEGTDDQRSYAANALGNLTIRNEANRTEIAAEGAIPLLVQLLASGTELEKTNAVFALVNLTASEANNAVIVRHNGIQSLISLLNGSEDQVTHAAQALGNMAVRNATYSILIAQAGAITLLCNRLSLGTDKQKSQVAFALGNLARKNPVNCAVIADTGGNRALVSLLSADGKLKTRVAKAIGVIGASSRSSCAEFVKQGVLPLLRDIAISGDEQQRNAALRSLRKLEWHYTNRASV